MASHTQHMTWQKLVIASVLLILILLFVGYAMSNYPITKAFGERGSGSELDTSSINTLQPTMWVSYEISSPHSLIDRAYYSLPVCRPSTMRYLSHSGSIFPSTSEDDGHFEALHPSLSCNQHHFINSAYEFSPIDGNFKFRSLCTTVLVQRDVLALRSAIEQQYSYQLMLDGVIATFKRSKPPTIGLELGMPSNYNTTASFERLHQEIPLGYKVHDKVMLYNHLKFHISVVKREDGKLQVVKLVVEPMSLDTDCIYEIHHPSPMSHDDQSTPTIPSRCLYNKTPLQLVDLLDDENDRRYIEWSYSVEWMELEHFRIESILHDDDSAIEPNRINRWIIACLMPFSVLVMMIVCFFAYRSIDTRALQYSSNTKATYCDEQDQPTSLLTTVLVSLVSVGLECYVVIMAFISFRLLGVPCDAISSLMMLVIAFSGVLGGAVGGRICALMNGSAVAHSCITAAFVSIFVLLHLIRETVILAFGGIAHSFVEISIAWSLNLVFNLISAMVVVQSFEDDDNGIEHCGDDDYIDHYAAATVCDTAIESGEVARAPSNPRWLNCITVFNCALLAGLFVYHTVASEFVFVMYDWLHKLSYEAMYPAIFIEVLTMSALSMQIGFIIECIVERPESSSWTAGVIAVASGIIASICSVLSSIGVMTFWSSTSWFTLGSSLLFTTTSVLLAYSVLAISTAMMLIGSLVARTMLVGK